MRPLNGTADLPGLIIDHKSQGLTVYRVHDDDLVDNPVVRRR